MVNGSVARDPRNGELLFEHGDEVLNVEFFEDKITGQEVVNISNPGQHDSDVYSTLATDKVIARFPDAYALFKGETGVRSPLAGQTSLSHASWLHPVVVKELNYRGCKTIEQLAAMSDADSKHLGIINLDKMIRQAKDFLSDVPKEEMDSLKEENEAMRKMLKDMQERVDKLEGTEKKPVLGRVSKAEKERILSTRKEDE